jgi:hypothetical protein
VPGEDPAAAGQPAVPGRAAAARDRDLAGRARNARPRDALGRPLPRDAAGQQPLTDEPALPPGQALELAQRLLDEGRPFHAHEVLEAAWKAAPAAERDLWQGLAQLAVGVTHALRGNPRGAVTLLSRGAARIGRYQAAGPHEVDVAGLCQRTAELIRLIESGSPAGLKPAELHLRLRTGPG